MLLPLALIATQLAPSTAADSLRVLALRLPESALVVETHARPLAVRDVVSDALARAVRVPADAGAELAFARHVASAYAMAWRDSFLVREVARFAAWPAPRRAQKVWADSVRRAGVAAWGRDGPATAIAIWRRALARARAAGDTAGIAAVLGNIGAGYLEEGRIDSAEALLARARALASAVGDVRVEANALGMMAGVREERGDLAGARAGYVQSLALRERIGDTRGVAADYNNLGLLAQTAGDPVEARRQFEAALSLNRREGRDDVAATNLVNLAALAGAAGELTAAGTMYRDALATWRTEGREADATSALVGLGQLELRRGDYRAAVTTLREAQAILGRTGPTTAALEVRRILASAHAAAGDLQAAIDELRIARAVADSTGVPLRARAGISLARADLAVQLNALADAERLYAEAEAAFTRAADGAGRSEAQHGRGLLYLARDDYARAEPVLQAALRGQLAAGEARSAALTRLALSQTARGRGDANAARRYVARAVADLDRLGDPVGAAAARGEWAAIEAALGLPAVAESLYRDALARVSDRPAPEVAGSLHAGMALALRAQQRLDAAAREHRAAIEEIERASRSLALPARRAAFGADKWDVYVQLALTERARGRPGSAFEASERQRSREMLDLLGRGRIGAGAPASDVVAREQDLRRRMDELMREAEQGAAGTLRGSDALPAGGARAALLRTQEAYSELLLEMRERAPRHASLVAPASVTWRDVARRLAPHEAMVEYLVSDSGSIAFIIAADTLVAVDLGVGRTELARLVELARGTLADADGATRDSLWRAPLRRLHGALIAPLEDANLFARITRLVIVPHAELHYVPFAALLDGGARYLVERFELAQAPSAAVWLALAGRPSARGTSGTLAFAPRPAELPASVREVALLARVVPDALALTGPAASEAAFRRDAPSRRILHLATYGTLNKQNPLFSFVDLAPGGGHDGRLEVHEVFGLELSADLVVLSACQTGLGSGALADVPAGDDWIGLARAFLHAGAANVVATLWPVEDRAAAALMEPFYGVFTSGADPVRALAEAQRAVLAQPNGAHPASWAGFVAVGGAGGR